ncbi:MAG: ion transporter [Lentilitoribacter sp.]|jgi:voltage-gated sodium channel
MAVNKSFRAKLYDFTESELFGRSILVLIVINAIILGMETSDVIMGAIGPLLHFLDRAILAIFVIEVIMRLIADFKGFWRNPWRIFDFVIVTISLIPATGALSAMRAFRILRVLRIVSQVRAMRRVVTGLLSALPGMGSIVLLLGLIFYVYAVISTKIFKDAFPEWFGSIGESSYTLFQIMTLESWSMGIVRPVMEEFPLSWMLFVPFIIMTAFTVLNLFIGVIVDAMQQEHEAEARAERETMMSENEQMLIEIRAMRKELQEIKASLK